jgi:hypothetical protein
MDITTLASSAIRRRQLAPTQIVSALVSSSLRALVPETGSPVLTEEVLARFADLPWEACLAPVTMALMPTSSGRKDSNQGRVRLQGLLFLFLSQIM